MSAATGRLVGFSLWPVGFAGARSRFRETCADYPRPAPGEALLVLAGVRRCAWGAKAARVAGTLTRIYLWIRSRVSSESSPPPPKRTSIDQGAGSALRWALGRSHFNMFFVDAGQQEDLVERQPRSRRHPFHLGQTLGGVFLDIRQECFRLRQPFMESQAIFADVSRLLRPQQRADAFAGFSATVCKAWACRRGRRRSHPRDPIRRLNSTTPDPLRAKCVYPF